MLMGILAYYSLMYKMHGTCNSDVNGCLADLLKTTHACVTLMLMGANWLLMCMLSTEDST